MFARNSGLNEGKFALIYIDSHDKTYVAPHGAFMRSVFDLVQCYGVSRATYAFWIKLRLKPTEYGNVYIRSYNEVTDVALKHKLALVDFKKMSRANHSLILCLMNIHPVIIIDVEDETESSRPCKKMCY